VSPPPIESPCRKLCAIDGASGRCIGCGRTLEEIANWLRYTPEQRRAIMRLLPHRAASIDQPDPEPGKRGP